MTRKAVFPIVVLFCLVAVAAGMRWNSMSRTQVIETDGCGYVRLAQLFSGVEMDRPDAEALRSSYPPGYPLGIRLMHGWIDDWETAGRVFSILCGSALVILVFFLCRYLYGQQAAFWAALLVTIEPVLITASSQVLTEMSFSFFLIGALGISFYFFEKPGLPSSFGAGMLWGICCLIKPEAAGHLLIVITCVLSGFFYAGKVTGKDRIFFASFIILGFAAVYAGGVLYGYDKIGSVDFLPNRHNAFGLLHLHKEGRSYEEIFYGLRGKIESSFALGLRDLLKSYCHQLYFTTQMDVLPRVFLLPLWVGGVLGLFRSPWDAILKKKVIFLLLFILFPLFFYPLFLVHERRFVPIIPLVMIFVAKGIIEFEHWFKETFGRNKWGLVLIFFLIASSFMPRLTGAMREKDPFLNEPAEYREAGRWMNEHLPLQAKIMARDPAIAFYADRRWEALPYGTLAEIVQNAKERQTDYIVFERYFAKLRPNLRYIMESDEELPGLKLVYRWDRRPEYKVLVYEVLSQS